MEWRTVLKGSLVVLMIVVARAGAESTAVGPYARWSHGPAGDKDFFPIAVWLQNPTKADRYLAAGFNLYVGLWRGPTEEQLRQLKRP